MIHLRLAMVMAITGFLFTSRTWLNFLQKFGPEIGLLVKYISIVITIFILDLADPTIKLAQPRRALGAVLVAMAFLMIFNYQSQWVEDAGAEKIEIQTPDGAVYYRARNVLKLEPESARILTFVVVPFLLVLAGSRLVRKGQKLNVD